MPWQIMGVGASGPTPCRARRPPVPATSSRSIRWSSKRDQAKIFGATHTAPDVPTALGLIADLSPWCDGRRLHHHHRRRRAGYVAEALSPVGRRGKVIVTAIGHPTELTHRRIAVRTDAVREVHPRGTFPARPARVTTSLRHLEDVFKLGELKFDELDHP